VLAGIRLKASEQILPIAQKRLEEERSIDAEILGGEIKSAANGLQG
jgi:hypothetical protein